ncbi:HAD family hydrolase [Anaerovibrio sp.]|uniref:HAD family hydrolase n=1 Tax=Anaerovibrio sp. TaxID=1872532 RepID=UPI003F16D7A6
MSDKAFIFDMDGVIIDSEHIHAVTKVQAVRSFGVDVSEADLDLRSYVGRSAKSFFSDMIAKYPELGDDWEVLAKRKHELYQRILREDAGLKPIAGIPELLARLKAKGYRIGLGSSSVMANIQLVLNRFGIMDYFDAIAAGSEVEHAKPEPDVYLLAARRLGVATENCTVIEDAGAGVMAAKAAGMRCIAIRNPNSGAQDLSRADMIIDSYEEIVL